MTDTVRVSLGDEQSDKLTELRRAEADVPTPAEMVRRLIDRAKSPQATAKVAAGATR